jgi:hypothetical protein
VGGGSRAANYRDCESARKRGGPRCRVAALPRASGRLPNGEQRLLDRRLGGKLESPPWTAWHRAAEGPKVASPPPPLPSPILLHLHLQISALALVVVVLVGGAPASLGTRATNSRTSGPPLPAGLPRIFKRAINPGDGHCCAGLRGTKLRGSTWLVATLDSRESIE